MFLLISFFWFIRQTKAILFWLYLWQLKEYHLGRFIDHFRTEKGKQLLFNKIIFLKLILFLFFLSQIKNVIIIPWYFYYVSISILVILYFFESAKGFFDFLQKKLKKPILTKKIFFLISLTLLFKIFYLFSLWRSPNFIFLILAFDFLTPAIVSGIILFFQPLAVLGRNQIIRRAIKKREKFKDLIVIGITGSYGKTSTKEFLAAILSKKYNVLKTKEHQNSEVGISQSILNELTPEHEIFVVEMGAYNRGGIKLLSNIVNPKIGIITGVNEQHLATFGSMENLRAAEGGKELIESLPQNGLIIFNGNNKHCQEIYQKTNKPKRIGGKTSPSQGSLSQAGFDIWAENIIREKEFLSFEIFSKAGERANFKVNLLGEQNVENILLATCCAQELGMSLTEIAQACQNLKPLPQQMELKKGFKGINIIDASYSANSEGVIAHLEYLKVWENSKKIIIMPCLIELGRASKEVHQRIGKKIAEVCDLAIITTKECYSNLTSLDKKSRWIKCQILYEENPQKIFEKIKNFSQEGDVVLLEGRVPNQLISFLIV